MRTAFSASGAAVAIVMAATLASLGCVGPERVPPPPARPGDERDALLRRIEERGKAARSIQADFVQHIRSPVLDQEDTRTGTLMMLKPGFLRLEWKTPPPGEVLICDGKFVWRLWPHVRRMLQQKVPDPQDLRGAQPPGKAPLFALHFGVPADDLMRDYAITLAQDAGDTGAYRLFLAPHRLRDRPEFTGLDVWVDKTSLAPVKFRFTKPNKEIETWKFRDPIMNEGVSAEDFKVPEGFQVIELPRSTSRPARPGQKASDSGREP